MQKNSVITIGLLIILLTSTVIIFSLIIAKEKYKVDAAQIQELLADNSVVNYFTAEEIETTYEVDGVEEPIIFSPLCTDCSEGIADMHNSDSLLIIQAPESLCDTEVERCILYNFDPFGLNVLEQQEILRNQK